MAYTAFAENKPVVSDTGLVVVDDMRNNLMALRDMLVSDSLFGFNYSWSTGSAAEPVDVIYKKGTEWVKVVRLWATGDNTKNRYYYSSDSGGAYDFIKREVRTYSTGSLDTSTWDDTDA